MLYTIKKLLGITDNSKDELIQILIDLAQSDFISLTHNNNLCEAENCITLIVVYKYNTLGSEGLNSENYSGVSFNYTAGYPSNIMKLINSFKLGKTL